MDVAVDPAGSDRQQETIRIIGIPPPLYHEGIRSGDEEALGYVERDNPTILPPSYSSVVKNQPTDENNLFITRQTPPRYNDLDGSFLMGPRRPIEHFYERRPMWRSRSQTAYCPRCRVFVLTVTQTHESLSTHVAALALCIFGCWPCCLLPYCISTCKNIHHICPICKVFLGAYLPW